MRTFLHLGPVLLGNKLNRDTPSFVKVLGKAHDPATFVEIKILDTQLDGFPTCLILTYSHHHMLKNKIAMTKITESNYFKN